MADEAGNWVACTATINTTFGSKVVIPGTGVVMNNQMDDFSVQPGVANYFGLIGAEANAIAPGKRPLSSMSPTLVFNGRQPIIALGAAGGPRIITTVAQELVAMLDLGKTPAEALAEPRFHQQWSPDELVVETALPEPVRAALLRARAPTKGRAGSVRFTDCGQKPQRSGVGRSGRPSGAKAMPPVSDGTVLGASPAPARSSLTHFNRQSAYSMNPGIELPPNQCKVLLELSAAMNAGNNQPGFCQETRRAFQVAGGFFRSGRSTVNRWQTQGPRKNYEHTHRNRQMPDLH